MDALTVIAGQDVVVVGKAALLETTRPDESDIPLTEACRCDAAEP